ncbi:hypothetical protein TBLA_0D05740 [Henningerozyma blattae CBS 6284]|uniref:glycogenin glucosyltransferase n=1 Tax=Henningerozyma blattae (strain ATCC 34711 / CBS 6284 / DSM 70876 / NBRC 10599 / NRRL Y-10934 / UCD 77-7) TaxID=1071380 RepID=I2H3W3_HENB6|nr:hypothetical protein TBLA_0D05740 [Tetrapisispora blattae CBS 6284]CCH61065.1 hypothetical protein TBLA_0D05740 [Tetrapisispora blattae CBS 6284]
MSDNKKAIVSLLYSADYLPGVFTLGYQLNFLLNQCHPDFKRQVTLVLMVTKSVYENDLSQYTRDILDSLYTQIIKIDPLKFQDYAMVKNAQNLNLINRPELSYALIKIKIWNLIQFDSVIYMDADTLPLTADFFSIFNFTQNQNEWEIAASPDIGWPDMFNSGIFALKPNLKVSQELSIFAFHNTSIDGADQGILNQFFNPICKSSKGNSNPQTNWINIPFLYNMTIPNSGYQYTPALNYFENDIKLVHFIGSNKPWKNWSPQSNSNDNKFIKTWNDIYYDFQLSKGLIKNLQNLNIQTYISPNDIPATEIFNPNINYTEQFESVSSSMVPQQTTLPSNNNSDIFQQQQQPQPSQNNYPTKPVIEIKIETPMTSVPEITDEEIERNNYGDSLYSFVKSVYQENNYNPDASVKRYWGQENNTLANPKLSLFSSHPFDSSWKAPLENHHIEEEQLQPQPQHNKPSNSNVPYGVLPTPNELASALDHEQLNEVSKRHIFSWETTDYLSNVERYFPDSNDFTETQDQYSPQLQKKEPRPWEPKSIDKPTRVFPGDEKFINPEKIPNEMIKSNANLEAQNLRKDSIAGFRESAPPPHLLGEKANDKEEEEEDNSHFEETVSAPKNVFYPHGNPKNKKTPKKGKKVVIVENKLQDDNSVISSLPLKHHSHTRQLSSRLPLKKKHSIKESSSALSRSLERQAQETSKKQIQEPTSKKQVHEHSSKKQSPSPSSKPNKESSPPSTKELPHPHHHHNHHHGNHSKHHKPQKAHIDKNDKENISAIPSKKTSNDDIEEKKPEVSHNDSPVQNSKHKHHHNHKYTKASEKPHDHAKDHADGLTKEAVDDNDKHKNEHHKTKHHHKHGKRHGKQHSVENEKKQAVNTHTRKKSIILERVDKQLHTPIPSKKCLNELDLNQWDDNRIHKTSSKVDAKKERIPTVVGFENTEYLSKVTRVFPDSDD